MSRVTKTTQVLRIDAAGWRTRPDTLAAEEPLEMRLGGRAVAVTMRTPGDDWDLVAGFLATEGVITRPEELKAMRYCAGKVPAADGEGPGENTYNVLDITLSPEVVVPHLHLERNFTTTSACGVCGKASIDAISAVAPWSVADDPLSIDPTVVAGLPEQLRKAQVVFDQTGGLHGAALFDASGALLCVREDVGRHNAVDKVIGWGLRAGRLPLRSTMLMVSGRASFELTQKARMAGIPALVAVSAPSSLAVDLAVEAGMTLIGFVRGDAMNVYAGAHRILPTA